MAIEFVDIEDLTLIPGRELTGTGEYVQVSATEKTSVADIAEYTRLEMERTGRPVYRLQGDYFSMYTGASGTIVREMMQPDGGFSALRELTSGSILVMPAGDSRSLVRIHFQHYDEQQDTIVWEFICCDSDQVPVYNRYELTPERMVKHSERLLPLQCLLPPAFATFGNSTTTAAVEAAFAEVGGIAALYEKLSQGSSFSVRCSDGSLVRLLSVKVSGAGSSMSYTFIKETNLVYVMLSKSGSTWQSQSFTRDLMSA